MIKESIFKGVKSYVMENECIRAEWIPYGSRMVSLIEKKTGREFLWQDTKARDIVCLPYGSRFAEVESSGFDEMFPTVDECFYPEAPWKGTIIPDHGELWNQNWELKVEKDKIVMRANGVRLPYTFEKVLYFTETNVLRTEYKVDNLCNHDFNFIWAPHALLNIDEGTEVLLPKNIDKKVMVVFSKTGRIGQYGDIQEWPDFKAEDGSVYKANVMRGNSSLHFEKYYFREMVSEGWCALRYVDNTVFKMSYPAEKLPYLGFWINEGGYAGQHNIAPEPCTGSMDRIDIAKAFDQIACIKGKGTYSWNLDITIDS